MTDDRKRILKMYEGLRVTDVADGMDYCMLQDVGRMSHEIEPLWRDVEDFTHRIYGFAHTVRFVPTQRRVPTMSPEEFGRYVGDWYRNLAQGPIGDEIQEGDVIVIDGMDTDVGFIGSNNCMGWLARGAVGAVTNAGCRDTDELIKQKCPVYARYVAPAIRPGRLELESTNKLINCGGVLVRPGDLIVADGDGVVLVPIEKVEDVAEHARRIADGDKAGRRKLYEKLGLPLDDTVKPLEGD